MDKAVGAFLLQQGGISWYRVAKAPLQPPFANPVHQFTSETDLEEMWQNLW